MSSGICILNKNGVAMAADSAVTLGNHLAIYNSANKLFSLSKVAPVGAIMYNNTSYMGVPFEVMIKEYRTAIGDKEYDYLEDYLSEFLNFISSNSDFFRFSTKEEAFILGIIQQCTKTLRSYISSINDQVTQRKGAELTEPEKSRAIDVAIDKLVNRTDSIANIAEASAFIDFLQKEYIDRIIKHIRSSFKDMTEEQICRTSEVCIKFCSKAAFGDEYTGLIIAGFGKKDLYPKAKHIQFSGMINKKVRYIEIDNISITDENFATIIPLAQTDVILSITQGYNPLVLDNFMNQILNGIKDEQQKKTLKQLPAVFKEMAQNIITMPMLKTIQYLPKEEMARFADSLINITSIQRMVIADNNNATVGGPIDVAILSRGDGFIWIKRKHYFDKDYNLQYLYNHYGSVMK